MKKFWKGTRYSYGGVFGEKATPGVSCLKISLSKGITDENFPKTFPLKTFHRKWERSESLGKHQQITPDVKRVLFFKGNPVKHTFHRILFYLDIPEEYLYASQ